MTLHKLTAGDGYLYLVRQVAAADSTERGGSSLADYYSAKGESPGRWMGRGLAALADTGAREVSDEVRQQVWTVEQGSVVTEAQMKALFGLGWHPNADKISDYLSPRLRVQPVIAATKLGRQYAVRDESSEFVRRVGKAFRAHNIERGVPANASIDDDVRAGIRTRVATELFGEQYGRPPADERELSGFIARATRARTTAVAGYDLTFSPVKSISALWAIAPPEIAEQIEAAHHEAVADVLEWLQDNATFTRTGTNGVAQVDTEGLIAAVFTHRDSRAGDPDLHTHVAISNKGPRRKPPLPLDRRNRPAPHPGPQGHQPDTAVDVLSRIVARDGGQVSATTAARQAADPTRRLAAAADMFTDALGAAAEHQLGAARRGCPRPSRRPR